MEELEKVLKRAGDRVQEWGKGRGGMEYGIVVQEYVGDGEVQKVYAVGERVQIVGKEEKGKIGNAMAENMMKKIMKEFGVELLGVDVLKDEETGKFCVVDVNYLPSYKEVENAPEWIITWIVRKMCEEVEN